MRAFSARLISSQLTNTSAADVDVDVGEHVRVAAHELVVDSVGDVDHREAPLLLGDGGVELDVVEQIAELLDHGGVGGGIVGVERLQRVDELERLLDEVGQQRLVGLLAVPRALLAQRSGELVEADVAVADGRAEAGHVDAREVVRLDGSIELAPGRRR